MKNLVLAVMAGVVLGGCSTARLDPGESPYETRVIPIENAERIDVTGAIKVSARGGSDTPQVRLTGPPEMIADAVVEVEGDTLSIRYADGVNWSWNPGSGMNAHVQLPKISSVGNTGPGSIDVRFPMASDFSAGTGGSGKINVIGLDAETVQLGVGGSGSIEVKGMANRGQFGIGGSGSIEAKRLRLNTAQIGIGGSGSVYADVSGSAEIGIGGSGRVEVVGGAECTFAESQANQIDCR